MATTLFILLAPGMARADAGFPMIVVIWRASFALLLPIVLIEALVGQRMFKQGFLHGLKVSAAANLVSTIIGIPLSWYLLALLEMPWTNWFMPPDTRMRELLAVTVGSPWLFPPDPRRDLPWMVPAAGLSLCVPFFFVSVASEALFARLILGASRRREALRWAWMANVLSYFLIVLCLAVRLIVAL